MMKVTMAITKMTELKWVKVLRVLTEPKANLRLPKLQLKWDWLVWKMACINVWFVPENSNIIALQKDIIKKNICKFQNVMNVLIAEKSILYFVTSKNTCLI